MQSTVGTRTALSSAADARLDRLDLQARVRQGRRGSVRGMPQRMSAVRRQIRRVQTCADAPLLLRPASYR